MTPTISLPLAIRIVRFFAQRVSTAIMRHGDPKDDLGVEVRMWKASLSTRLLYCSI